MLPVSVLKIRHLLGSQHHYCQVIRFVKSNVRYPSQFGKDVCSHGHDDLCDEHYILRFSNIHEQIHKSHDEHQHGNCSKTPDGLPLKYETNFSVFKNILFSCIHTLNLLRVGNFIKRIFF